LSEHQTSQVMTAHRLDQLLPANRRVIGSEKQFMTLQDVWTEQRALEYIRLVARRAAAYWGEA
jgi:hypothetical protein